MKNPTTDLPPKLQPFAFFLDAQPPEVQEAFQFPLATAMHEAGKQTRNPLRAILDRGKDKDYAQDHNLQRRHPL